jgi:hypothetical protein
MWGSKSDTLGARQLRRGAPVRRAPRSLLIKATPWSQGVCPGIEESKNTRKNTTQAFKKRSAIHETDSLQFQVL